MGTGQRHGRQHRYGLPGKYADYRVINLSLRDTMEENTEKEQKKTKGE